MKKNENIVNDLFHRIRQYKFTDEVGNPLELCKEYQELVDYAEYTEFIAKDLSKKSRKDREK